MVRGLDGRAREGAQPQMRGRFGPGYRDSLGAGDGRVCG